MVGLLMSVRRQFCKGEQADKNAPQRGELPSPYMEKKQFPREGGRPGRASTLALPCGRQWA